MADPRLYLSLDTDHFAQRTVRIAKNHIASCRLGFFCSFVKSHSTAEDFTARKASCLLKVLHILCKIKRHSYIKPRWGVQYSHFLLWGSVSGGAPPQGLPLSTEQRVHIYSLKLP